MISNLRSNFSLVFWGHTQSKNQNQNLKQNINRERSVRNSLALDKLPTDKWSNIFHIATVVTS